MCCRQFYWRACKNTTRQLLLKFSKVKLNAYLNSANNNTRAILYNITVLNKMFIELLEQLRSVRHLKCKAFKGELQIWKSCIKPFVALEGSVWNLINYLSWCHLLRLKTTVKKIGDVELEGSEVTSVARPSSLPKASGSRLCSFY